MDIHKKALSSIHGMAGKALQEKLRKLSQPPPPPAEAEAQEPETSDEELRQLAALYESEGIAEG